MRGIDGLLMKKLMRKALVWFAQACHGRVCEDLTVLVVNCVCEDLAVLVVNLGRI